MKKKDGSNVGVCYLRDKERNRKEDLRKTEDISTRNGRRN